MGNVDRAARLIAEVRAAGVEEFCVCAGSRNSPLLAVLGSSGLPLFSFVDERSAAFFALGRFKLNGRPIAVVTTSGTAVAELLPAAIEAHYARIPLILITADRPKHFRGTGAPQSIEQLGLFGVYAETSLESWSRTRPLHLNIEFDEPLLGTPESAPDGPTASTPAFRRPLVILGALAPHHHARVRNFINSLNAPVYAEPLSGLREDPTLPLITAGERLIPRYEPDLIIRIGNVPTLRFWRDLEDRTTPVVHYSDNPFTGLTRGELHPIESLPEMHGTRDDSFFEHDKQFAERFAAILDDEPQSELALIRKLSHEIAANSRVYLGNSLPIREWDLAASRARAFLYEANRGANGIDGQLSTFFGWCDPTADNICLLGDLTTIYDLNAPWIVPQLGHRRFRIVVMNNGGGRIFSRVASLRALDPAMRERIVENAHDVRFDEWAKMWSIDVTELRPDEAASKRVWARYDALWS
jgi:2-succinyl-5-enolpyruvyl-6-hydroxy-3-cyclohexene-1-carboxylate synthase